jgi:hypothetical protein
MKKLLIILIVFSSCSSSKSIRTVRTKKEINRAMKYSSWQYVMPKTQH